MENFLFNHSGLLDSMGYWLAFLGMIIEGDAVIFIAFFLAYHNYFEIIKLFIVLFTGALIGDVIWYYFGAWIHNSSFIARLAKKFKIIDNHFIKRPFYTIFISKFTYGLHHFLLARAGALKFNLKELIKYDIVASIIWIFSIGVLGYLSGASFLIIKKYLKFTEAGLFLILLLFIIIEYFVRRKSKKEL